MATQSKKRPAKRTAQGRPPRSLGRYRQKRDFDRTPEPRGRKSPRRKAPDPIFTIQKHAASHLHYDFRLEVGGVLKSWAVPKGPSTNPADKRLAVEVEDHPLDYAGVEGVIPKGQYGGGTVIVWDKGTYRNIKADKDGRPLPMVQALEQGAVEVWLEGEKLHGGYALIRTAMRGNKKNWLLIKMRDEGANPRRDPVTTQPQSVISGRTMERVAAGGGGGHER